MQWSFCAECGVETDCMGRDICPWCRRDPGCDADTETAILSIGDEFMPLVARKVRDGVDLSDADIEEYNAWIATQLTDD